jgi:TonB family protein
MTRLQKKCLIAVASTHLLVIVAILCSGFLRPTPKPDDSDILTAIPANLVDALLNSGVKNAPTPAPTPPTPTPPTPVVQPPPPTPPTPPVPTPQPTVMERVKEIFTPKPPPVDETKPADIPEPKRQPHKIEVSLKPVVRTVSKTTDDNAAEQAREQKRLRNQRLKAIAEAARSIEKNASSATTVEMPGSSSVSYANYASAVKSIYERNWITPDNGASDESVVRVSVTIRNDGNVESSSILTPSGDSSVDASVQRTLDRVTFVAPFPEGATEKERTFIINFNLKAKRMFG